MRILSPELPIIVSSSPVPATLAAHLHTVQKAIGGSPITSILRNCSIFPQEISKYPRFKVTTLLLSAKMSVLLASSSTSTHALRLCCQANPEYVESLHEVVLRIERYDLSKAAARLIRFLDWKLYLFGPELLDEPVVLWTDLGKEERRIVRKGHIQVLPRRDRAGRRIVFWNREYHPSSPNRGQCQSVLLPHATIHKRC